LGRLLRASVVFVITSILHAAGGGAPCAATGTTAVAGTAAASAARPTRLDLKSNVALVLDEADGQTIYAKNTDKIAPIASITKLMTAMVVLDAHLALDQEIRIEKADVDRVKNSHSRLPVGTRLTRGDLLWLALMASENRAAAALARTYPGGAAACVAAMNRRASEIGMLQSRFTDPTGLSEGNVASAHDLARLVRAAAAYPAIREFSTSTSHMVTLLDGRVLQFRNSNGLVSNKAWTIGLSKTGYISAAGRCLVMEAVIAARPVIIVLLDSWGKYTRQGDANRIRKWMEAAASSAAGAIGAVSAHGVPEGTPVTGAAALPTARPSVPRSGG
jgi:D-alanyl-D-alanine endopeptidase (penicillin-binding protein 7)